MPLPNRIRIYRTGRRADRDFDLVAPSRPHTRPRLRLRTDEVRLRSIWNTVQQSGPMRHFLGPASSKRAKGLQIEDDRSGEHDTDDEWAFFEPFISAVRAANGLKSPNHRLALDGIFWIARTGAPWRDLPEEWGQVVECLPAVPALDAGRALGGHHGRAKPERSGAGRAPDDRQHSGSRAPSGSGLKKGTPRPGLGRSRGGFTTKIHLLVDAHGLPVRPEITPGQTSDYLGFGLVMADNLPVPSVLLADRGYDADSIRRTMEQRDALPIIPMRKSRKRRVGVDRSLYRLRNLVERCFNKLKTARRVATRYDKTPESFLGFVDIASIRLWFRHL